MNQPCRLEDAEQLDVVRYLTLKKVRFHHSPNGGKRHMKTAVEMKALGVSPGFPDLIVFPADDAPIAIEMKRVKGSTTSPEQKEWLSFLNGQGWRVCVAFGSGQAIDFLQECGI